MKNMRIPIRPAPSIEEARHKYNFPGSNNCKQQPVKKKPPPRPPPPDFTKIKSKSTLNLLQPVDKICLIEWSPPGSPKSTTKTFGGSISSSFSSSTSSLASSKKSFEYETAPFNISPWNQQTSTNFTSYVKKENTPHVKKENTPQLSVPTIIRAQPSKNKVKSREISPVPSTSKDLSDSPPMPSIPPPSPPKDIEDKEISFGIALYNFPGTQIGDLPLQENDIVLLLRRVNNEWLYGRIDDKEGIFPANFVDIQVPLPQDDKIVTALYEFKPQMQGDLALKPGQTVKVSKKISDEWLYGESNGLKGQFPSNFVDRIPTGL